jgi:hypothetical protein
MMTGLQFTEVRDAIARAFGADEFDMFLYERLNFNRPDYVADGPFKLVVTNVLKHFEREGLDPYLIAEVAAARPKKADVQEVYRKYARALIGGRAVGTPPGPGHPGGVPEAGPGRPAVARPAALGGAVVPERGPGLPRRGGR